MDQIKFIPLSSPLTKAYRAGARDANGQQPERFISDGSGIPCRHCLRDVEVGEPYLLLAHRPFPSAQPYAETGPVFIHAEPCSIYTDQTLLPPVLAIRDHMLIRGYNFDNRICEGTGQIVSTADIKQKSISLLMDPVVHYLHVRSATNNCFQCRIERV